MRSGVRDLEVDCEVQEGASMKHLLSFVVGVLSDFVFDTTSRQGAHRGALIRLLKLYAVVPMHRRGATPAAVFPQITELALNENGAESVRGGLGLTFSQERGRWDAIRARG